MRWIIIVATFFATQAIAASPDFSGRDKAWAQYRTRIREGMKRGPNFSDHMTIVSIGCGTGCRIYPVVDLRTGRVWAFPLGGEDFQMLNLSFSIAGPDIIATWSDQDVCFTQNVKWGGSGFALTPATKTPCKQPE